MGSDAQPVLDEQVRQAARASDPDRYLSALLAPNPYRADLVSLAAFSGEVARISTLVNEPMMGALRLQWWREALQAAREGGTSGNPVADAVCRTIAHRDLPDELFLSILDAREQELMPEFPESEPALERYLDDTEGAALRLAARTLDVSGSKSVDELLFAAGQAIGRVRLLMLLPALYAKGRGLPLGTPEEWEETAVPMIAAARDWLAETRRQFVSVQKGIVPVVLPVALVEPYLQVFEGLGTGMARERADLSPLARVWKLWLASMRGRV